MRAPYEGPTASATPIYDSLCAEYRRLFRALPGDRSGEEELRFVAFGTIHGVGYGSWGDYDRRHGGYGYGYPGEPAPAAALTPARHEGGAHSAVHGL
ncbi:hypothetical protein [Streptomyces hoynatensis]|uniref:Uncharacterized protein n=1 Tax=Streptomyces hoynatensis TaxID=1141874 RepID=A0A3A9Z6N4_9ACTN|nr:hypothetical protein D7294_08320 [Streptomyces hoynatensis]